MSAPTILTLVPARLGSKGWPGKNRLLWPYAKPRLGRPQDLIAVTTDDPELSKLAAREGFLVIDRPPELATDTAKMVDVVAHACHQLPPHDGVLVWQLTQPCRRRATMQRVIETWRNQRARGTVVTVQRVPDHYVPQRTVQVWANGMMVMNQDDAHRRQDAKPAYIRDGQAYLTTWRRALERNWYHGLCTAVIEREPLPLPIDTEQDWQIAKAYLSAPKHQPLTELSTSA